MLGKAADRAVHSAAVEVVRLVEAWKLHDRESFIRATVIAFNVPRSVAVAATEGRIHAPCPTLQ